MALKATAVVLVGRATISGCPLGPFAATADPTGMSASFTSGRVDAAEGLAVSVGALVGDDDVVDCAGWELGLDELEHPVTTSAPAAVPPTSTARRRTDFATMPPRRQQASRRSTGRDRDWFSSRWAMFGAVVVTPFARPGWPIRTVQSAEYRRRVVKRLPSMT